MRKLKVFFIVLALCVFCNTGFADSEILTPVDSSATAADILTDYYIAGYDIESSSIAAWANNSLQLFSGSTVVDLGTPTDYSGWNSFVKQDPSGTSAWIGFTSSGNTDDRIYQVDYATGAWTLKATLASNFDLEFYDGKAYVSGLNSTDWSDPTCIWLLDTTGNNNHDKIVEMSSNSAGLAFDSAGNVVYASYDGMLYRWSAADVLSAEGSEYLTYLDGTKLADLEAGAYDITIDSAGNIIFNGNGSSSYIAVWNGIEGDGNNYDILSIGSGDYGNWHTFLDSIGDVLTDGTYYQADYYSNGIAEVVVPEPATIAVLTLGGLILARRKRA